MWSIWKISKKNIKSWKVWENIWNWPDKNLTSILPSKWGGLFRSSGWAEQDRRRRPPALTPPMFPSFIKLKGTHPIIDEIMEYRRFPNSFPLTLTPCLNWRMRKTDCTPTLILEQSMPTLRKIRICKTFPKKTERGREVRRALSLTKDVGWLWLPQIDLRAAASGDKIWRKFSKKAKTRTLRRRQKFLMLNWKKWRRDEAKIKL